MFNTHRSHWLSPVDAHHTHARNCKWISPTSAHYHIIKLDEVRVCSVCSCPSVPSFNMSLSANKQFAAVRMVIAFKSLSSWEEEEKNVINFESLFIVCVPSELILYSWVIRRFIHCSESMLPNRQMSEHSTRFDGRLKTPSLDCVGSKFGCRFRLDDNGRRAVCASFGSLMSH